MFTHVEILALGQLSDIDKTVKVLNGLTRKIEDLEEVEVASHELPAPRCGHVAFIARFADRDAYEAFQQHPEYHKAKQFLERVNAKTVHVAYPDRPGR